ncbi:MAG: LysR family transcriptional regulator [Pseudomonadota bacterium]|nr:LysR family transcriptional regulator [Pseudomonadota bacterium]
MDIRQLRYFVAIADQHSMSLASGKLGVAQPSLSHHVMRLEEELGVQLLVRSTRGVTLTESGQRLYAHALAVIKAVEVAVADLRDQSSELSGPVSFAFPSSVSNVLTVPLSETVRNEFPKIVLRAMDAMSGHVQTWLTEGSIDFGILYDVNCAPHLDMRPLLVEELFLVAASDSWKGEIGKNGIAKEAVSLRDCGGLGLILPHREHGLRETVERIADAQSLRLDVVMEMDSLSRIKTLVARGSGYSLLAHAAVHEELERGELVLVPVRDPAMRRTVYLASNPARPIKRAAREVERLAVAIVSELVRKGYWRGELAAPPAGPAKVAPLPVASRVRKAAE